MKTRYLIIFICLTILGLSACETTEKIDDFPLRPSQLVVNCFFTEDSNWKFQVSKSLSVLDNAQLKLIDNATIRLYSDSKLIETINEHDKNGWYRSDDKSPEFGMDYSIEVSAPNFSNTLRAEDFVPDVVPISSVSVVIWDSTFYEHYNHYGDLYYGGNVEGNFNILFSDPPDIDNYYQFSIYYLDTVYFSPDSLEYEINPIKMTIWSDDSGVESGDDYSTEMLLTDYLFDGQDYKLKVNFREWRPKKGRQYNFELTTLNRSGYLYRKSIVEFNKSVNDPFAEPVMIYCNIENGYGIFSGYTTNTIIASFW